jgi:hypothetical protein
MDKWSSVTLVHLPNELDDSVSEGVRVAANDLTRQGVPKEIFEAYRAAEAITHIVVNRKNLLRFGRDGLYSSMCMDVATGSIVTLAPDSTTRFVNSSLEKFIETAKAVTARFPFYGENDADVKEVVDRAVKDVTDAIRSVEESAFERDGFWGTLVADIQMGDFATEWIVSGRFRA